MGNDTNRTRWLALGWTLAAAAFLPGQVVRTPKTDVATHLQVVVRDAAGEPAANATLVWLPSERLREHARSNQASGDASAPGDEVALLRARIALGTPILLDEHGSAQIASGKHGVLIGAAGDLLGQTYVGADDDTTPKTVTLHRIRDHHVRVRFESGDAAPNVRVRLRDEQAHLLSVYSDTDADGNAHFRTIGPRTDKGFACIVVLGHPDVRASLARPDSNSDEPVDIVLPACGHLIAELDRDILPGAPARWQVQVGKSHMHSQAQTSDVMHAKFPLIAAGRTGTVFCQRENVRFQAPLPAVAEQQTTTVRIKTTDTALALARLLSDDGTPIREGTANYRWTAKGSMYGDTAKTTKQALIAFPHPNDGTGEYQLHLDVRDSEGRLRGTVDVKVAELANPHHDLGELRLTPSVLGLAGRVQTTSGAPIAGINLRIGNQHVKCDDDGTFELWTGKDDKAPQQIQLTNTDWYLTEAPYQHKTIDPANQPVVLELQPAARVLFGCDGLPDSRVHHQLTMYLEASGAHDDERVQLHLYPQQRQTLLMPPGRWDVVFEHVGMELHRIEGLTATAGIENHDARAMFFDWPAFLRLIEVRIEDEQGKPFDGCTVWLRHSGSGSGTRPRDGVLHLLVPKDGQRVEIERRDGVAGGKVDLGVVNTDQIVRFGSGPRLLVTTAKPPPLPSGTKLLIVVGDREQTLDDTGRAAVWLERADRWQPALAIVRGEQRVDLRYGMRTLTVPAGGTQFEVPDDERFQKALAEALRKLQ